MKICFRIGALIVVLFLSSAAYGTTTFGTTAAGPLAYNPLNTFVYASNGFNPNLPAWVWSTGGFEFTVATDLGDRQPDRAPCAPSAIRR